MFYFTISTDKVKRMKSPFLHILLIALGVGFLAVSMYDVKYVEGNSMAPTLNDNEAVIIYRWAYGLQPPLVHRYLLRWGRVAPGELVYFHDPVCRYPVVKRCAGAADTVILYSRDEMRVGDAQLSEAEIFQRDLLNMQVIPDGKLFLLGDNRRVSFDSRHYGLIDEENIEGRIIRLW